MKQYKTYLFDFDGTLVDSMPYYGAAMLRILDENKVQYGADILKIITPLGIPGTADYFITMGMKLPKEQILERMKAYLLDAYLYKVPAKSNVISTLRALKAAGASVHVLTASPHMTVDPCLKRLGMYDLFENVWSCDDFATTKADPQIYVMAAQRIGKPIDEILFLDDNYNADLTAKQAGMQVCGVYDETSKEYAAQIKAIADAYIYDFSELLIE